jgi:hypothetical protein
MLSFQDEGELQEIAETLNTIGPAHLTEMEESI